MQTHFVMYDASKDLPDTDVTDVTDSYCTRHATNVRLCIIVPVLFVPIQRLETNLQLAANATLRPSHWNQTCIALPKQQLGPNVTHGHTA